MWTLYQLSHKGGPLLECGCYEKDKIASVGEVNSLQQRFFDLDVMGNSTEDPYNVKQK